MLGGLGDPLSVDVQYFLSIRNRANSPYTHCTQMPCHLACSARPTKRELRSGRGRFATTLPACGCAGCGSRDEGCLGPCVGLPDGNSTRLHISLWNQICWILVL